MKKIKMFITFIIAAYKFFKRGCATLDTERRNERLFVCKQCEELKNHRCQICGCWVALKTYCIDEECPILKWTKVEAVCQNR